ncbi:MAG: hypothetical protein AB7L90_06615 [Hyphomicrobiaceae bacterium]
MRPTNPPFRPFETKEERETSLIAFIRNALDATASGRVDAISVLARSPSSPVVAALLTLSEELAATRVGSRFVLAGGSAAAENETWNLTFSASFVHEIRLTSSPRVLDGHEQLIVGDRAVWFGDCMRRDPTKRDAFNSYLPNDPATARASRFAFQSLWQRAQSIYRNGALSSVVVTSSEETGASTVAAVPAGPVDTLRHLGGNGSSVAETLAAWQPLTRH